MKPCSPRLTLHLAAVLAVGCLSSWAQQTTVNSKPADVSPEKANSFMDNRSPRLNNDHNAPRSLFEANSPNLVLPPPVYFQNQDPVAREAANRRKNWTLLTPEEIMGVKTPEQILGLDKDKYQAKLTLEQEFLQRQRKPAGTNGLNNPAYSRNNNNPFSRYHDEQNPFSQNKNEADYRMNETRAASPSRYLDSLNRNAAPGSSGFQRDEESPWASGFARPSVPKPSPEELAKRNANMERFRALMEPAPQPAQAANPGRYSASPATAEVDPYLQPQPKVNPVGHSIQALEDTSARPTGITPLPPVTGSVQTPVQTRPAWQAQPPPWLSDKPQHDLNRRF